MARRCRTKTAASLWPPRRPPCRPRRPPSATGQEDSGDAKAGLLNLPPLGSGDLSTHAFFSSRSPVDAAPLSEVFPRPASCTFGQRGVAASAFVRANYLQPAHQGKTPRFSPKPPSALLNLCLHLTFYSFFDSCRVLDFKKMNVPRR